MELCQREVSRHCINPCEQAITYATVALSVLDQSSDGNKTACMSIYCQSMTQLT